ncbi:biotin/lipoyl-binding protein [Gemmobacter lanyuensis]
MTEILTSEAARLRSFPGLIAARVETALAFQTTGRVASRPADRGDRVKAGDVLATLDQITLGEDVAAARAAVAAAQAQADLAGQSLARAERLNQRGWRPRHSWKLRQHSATARPPVCGRPRPICCAPRMPRALAPCARPRTGW